ncbi:MAG: NAD-dependent epimerase/dehydratase family protein, partial [SAR324 cluster bacterium]|nr:NAD-dependent epimerase/dehydratase family protein [SAR324 cluster bacterium]
MNPKFIVTGGGGFLGKALSLRLKSLGLEVHSISRNPYPELLEAGIVHHQADLSDDLRGLRSVFEGASALFHTAAKVDMWGLYEDFYRANVQATKNLLEMCKETKLSKFIYTSSPSVIANGNDLCGVDESMPYPEHFEALYPATKAMAEKEVLLANGRGGLRTIALRPHLIFGPGDTNLMPTIIERARSGRLIQVGDGTNKVDFTYIEDCVEAHIKAADALDKNPQAGGRAYFISQGEPIKMWDWINEVLTRSGLPPLSRKISFKLAYFIGGLSE